MNESRRNVTNTTDDIPERELLALTALLRGLPDPEPPADLVERVMARVAEREARPRVIRLLFGAPSLGTALAAGLAGLLVLSISSTGLLPPLEPRESEPAPLEPTVAHIVTYGTGSDASVARIRRPVTLPFASEAVIDPQAVAFFGPAASQVLALPAPTAGSRIATSPLDHHLDRQLNQLLLDPGAFYRRLDRVRDSESFVERLADRAARRGDAAEIALRLRQQLNGDERTAQMVERLLWATLSSSVPRP